MSEEITSGIATNIRSRIKIVPIGLIAVAIVSTLAMRDTRSNARSVLTTAPPASVESRRTRTMVLSFCSFFRLPKAPRMPS